MDCPLGCMVQELSPLRGSGTVTFVACYVSMVTVPFVVMTDNGFSLSHFCPGSRILLADSQFRDDRAGKEFCIVIPCKRGFVSATGESGRVYCVVTIIKELTYQLFTRIKKTNPMQIYMGFINIVLIQINNLGRLMVRILFH